METAVRKPLQGVFNIIRFNWHFYLLVCVTIVLLWLSLLFIAASLHGVVYTIVFVILFPAAVSLIISCYVYDFSGLYDLAWTAHLGLHENSNIINVNAGFDETSLILKAKFPQANLQVFDFYDPATHTEASIARARRAYGPYTGTISISTDHIPVTDHSIDCVFNIFSLHEIRNTVERTKFLRCQRNLLKDDGRCVVMEHLRDIPNFLAYNIGFFHFHSQKEWDKNFSLAGFRKERVIRVTRFVSVFILKKEHDPAA
jgi:hypothetical protein